MPWKEEGEVPAWSDGGGGTETVVDHNIMGAGGQEKEKKPPAQNSNCRIFEKDLSEILSRKEKIKRKHWARECGEFSDLAINC